MNNMSISEFLNSDGVIAVLVISMVVYIIGRVLESPAFMDSPASERRLARLPDEVRRELQRVPGVITQRDVRLGYATVAAARAARLKAEHRNSQGAALQRHEGHR